MTMRLRPDDPRLSWHGAVSLEWGDGWVRPWRIPFEQQVLFGTQNPSDRLLSRAKMPAGVRIAFLTDSTTVGCEVEGISPDPGAIAAARVDVCCDGELHQSVLLTGPNPPPGPSPAPFPSNMAIVSGLPSREKLIEVWLPHYCEVRVHAIELDEGASVRSFEDPRPRLLVYGSSNTQSRGAESPIYTWPAVVARRCDMNLTNLGYGSACHLDPMVARLMRDLPADVIAMEIGINIYINAAFNAVSLRAAFIGFVQTLRDGHPSVPIVVMSSLYSVERETTPNAAGLTLQTIREELADAVSALHDQNLHYVNGLDLFGADMVEMLPDRLHPSAEGYKILGERFATGVMARIIPGVRPGDPSQR
jgi:lysophospholipase L1-like esterase